MFLQQVFHKKFKILKSVMDNSVLSSLDSMMAEILATETYLKTFKTLFEFQITNSKKIMKDNTKLCEYFT